MRSEAGSFLVVDDNEPNRDLLVRRLRRSGHAVTAAASGHEALALIAARRFDCVLLDVMMPEMGGIEVLDEIRRRYSLVELPVIMVTAREQSADVVEAFGHGANDYVTKPIDFPVVRARAETQLRLVRLDRLKDEFIRIASHDLKNPLGAIDGFAGLIERAVAAGDGPVGRPIGEYAARLRRQVTVMQRIISDFLDFQALDEGRLALAPEPVDLAALLAEAVAGAAEAAAAKGIRLLLPPPAEGDCRAMADPARMRQVIGNILGNAIKFSPAGTCVTARCRADGGSVLVEVSDQGPGLAVDDLDKLFIKYCRLSAKPTGGEKSSGLGLYISRTLVAAHGGEIGARNNDGSGATFWFRLPGRTEGL